MANPVLTATLTTPISITLSWDVSGDTEVWWKSDHPAGQDFVRLAVVNGTSYLVGSLSWTTTYYFKVRSVSGATYSGFSNEINLFVCCGQAVMIGAPASGGAPPLIYADYWQQGVVPESGEVAIAVKTINDDAMSLYRHDAEKSLYLLGGAAYLNQFQAAVRKLGTAIAVFDVYAASEFFMDWGWYMFSYWDGATFRNTMLPIENQDYFDYVFINLSIDSAGRCMEFNQDGRIVVGLSYANWYSGESADWHEVYAIMYSNDRGLTWSEQIIIAEPAFRDPKPIQLAETDDGAIWITTVELDPNLDDRWYNAPVTAVYKVYRWTEAGGYVLKKTIPVPLTSVYGPAPAHAVIDPALNSTLCSISAEGGKIVLAYNYEHVVSGGTPFYGEMTVKVEVSDDYGATWSAPVAVSFTDAILQASIWRATLPAVCLSSGNILLFVYGGTGAAIKYYMLRSTDDGATWTVVYEFPGLVANYGYDNQMRSDGDHVVFAGCGMTVGAGNPMAYFESLDAGATWTAVDMDQTVNPVILVPT